MNHSVQSYSNCLNDASGAICKVASMFSLVIKFFFSLTIDHHSIMMPGVPDTGRSGPARVRSPGQECIRLKSLQAKK